MFAGGGLMAVGLKTAGFSLTWANDFEKTAVKAYSHNLGGHITLGDITQIDPHDIPDTDIIAGGPPCQDFSVAGTGAGENGDKGRLVWTYLSIIERKMPKAFIFENVKGLIQKKHRHTFDALLLEFEGIGYRVSWQLVNSWDYGVAQKRERVFIVGTRKDLGFVYKFPQPVAEDVRTQVLRDVIGDLPEPGEHFYVNRQSWKVDNRVQQVFGLDDVAPTLKAQNMPFPPGYEPSGKDAHVQNHKPQLLSPTVREKVDSGGYDAYLKKHPIAEMDKVSPAVVSQWHKGAPNGLVFAACVSCSDGTQAPRRFTVRECLRIQSVPDWYVIPEGISLGAQYRIVGNGVASRVAWYLGKALAEQITINSPMEVAV